MNVGLVFTTATDELLREDPELVLNLTDAPETIDAVEAALVEGGHTVTRFNTDHTLPAKLTGAAIDIAFNIATGIYGDTRPALVPALLDHLRIPHTGPGVFAETVTHHKPAMKTLLLAHGLPTPPFQVLRTGDEPLDPALRFPLIAKLPAEGGSLGLGYDSVATGEDQLRAQVARLLARYRQGVLAEEFIEGREFTVPVLGNRPPYALPIVERLFLGDCHIMLDEPEETTLRQLEELTGQTYTFTPDLTQSVTPADVPDATTAHIQRLAVAAYTRLRCQDWARVDMRMDERGKVYIIDVNLEPAIAPGYALAKSAAAAGWSYAALVNRILDHALERYAQLHEPLPPRVGHTVREWRKLRLEKMAGVWRGDGH